MTKQEDFILGIPATGRGYFARSMAEQQPEMLAGLEDGEGFRHPMWKAPETEEQLPVHVRALLTQVAASLTPFDGRPNSDIIIAYCEAVYDACVPYSLTDKRWTTDNYLWVLGKVVYLSASMRRRLQKWLDDNAVHPANRPLYVQDIKVIERLERVFTEAICKEIS